MNNETYKNAQQFLKNSYSVSSVPKGTNYWVKFLLSKCQNLFIYKNLPETLPQCEIEKNLIIKGNGAVVKKNGNLYIPFTGNVYGFDEYMIPNKFTYANPVIGGDSGLIDGKNCAIIWNSEIDKIDCQSSWMWDTIRRYARMLADLESSFVNALVYSRGALLAQASNQSSADAMNIVINKLKAGDVSTVVNSQMSFDSLKEFTIQPVNSFAGFIEARDYLINCFLNSIGLQTLEEKKERMITDELNVDGDVLNNNIDILYIERIKNVEHINKVFGTNIEVYKNEILRNEIIEEEDVYVS